MTPETAILAMVAMYVVYMVFLLAVRLEVRRSLRSLQREWSKADAKEIEADYQMIMARLNARKRLAQMRAQAQHRVGRNGYKSGLTEGDMRLITRQRRQLT